MNPNHDITNPVKNLCQSCIQQGVVGLIILTTIWATSHAAAQSGSAADGHSDTIGWSSFRNGGNSQVTQDAKLPVNWSPDEGIAWKVELPGYGQSVPLIVNDKVLITAVEGANKDNNLVICFDRKTGKEVWRTSRPSSMPGPSNYMYSRAAPTSVVDKKRMFAFFESGDVLAVQLSDGKTLWAHDFRNDIGDVKTRHGLGSSLAQTDEMLFVNLEHDGPSALLAINKSDGTISWKTKRPSGSSWSSPVVMRREDRSQIVVSSSGEAAGYDSTTGRVLWKVDGLSGNSVPSPLVIENRIYLGARMPEFGSVSSAAKSNVCLEFEEGEIEPKIRWRSERCIADYSSPVVCGEFLFLINGSGILGCLDKHTGEEMYRKRLGFECWATPIVHRNQMYVFGKNGVTAVIQADREFKKISENRLWDAANPPRPVWYTEYFPKTKNSGHGQHGHSDADGQGKPGDAMLAGLLKADIDGDEVLSGNEIPKRLAGVIENLDLNRDGDLDKSELEKMAKSFAAKRAGSKQSSRDPIVYGVAADASGILVRTGTTLYAVGGETDQ